MNNKKLSIILILVVSLFFVSFSNPVYSQVKGTTVKKPKVVVSYIQNIFFTVKKGESFKLPSTINAEMSNNTTKNLAVKWNASNINTDKLGTFKYYGKVSGYSRKVTLTLTVEKLTIKDIAKEANKIILLKIFNDKNEQIASGSGFILTRDGKVITNYHVIEYGKTIKAVLSDNEEYSVSNIVDYDKSKDIAMIQLETNKKLDCVKLGNSDKLEVGEDIVAIGSPLGFQNTISTGIVSGIRQEGYREGYKDIQISAPISHGSSGGALFNMSGEVVGITYAGVIDGENLNFAIPINDIEGLDYSNSHTFSDVYEKEHIIKYENGDVYEGDIIDDCRDGYGVLKMVTGDKYEGQFVDDKYDGTGVYTWKDGSTYKGEWKKGNRDGKGIENWIDGDRYEGDYKDDTRTGKGVYYYVNGNVYEGEFLNNKMQGKGTFYYANGEKYVGDFVNDYEEGKGSYYFPNGEKYVGDFKKDKFDGNGVYTWPNGMVYEGVFGNDAITDKGTLTLPSGEKVAVRVEGNNMIFTDEKNNTITVPMNNGSNNNTSIISNNINNNAVTQKSYYVNINDPLKLINIFEKGDNVVVKWGYLVIGFDRKMDVSLDPTKVIIESASGEKIQVTSIQPGTTAPDNLLLVFSGSLKPNTQYRVFIPKNTIFSADGQCYPYDIEYTFKTAP